MVNITTLPKKNYCGY